MNLLDAIPEDLDPARSRAILALLNQPTIAKAAEEAGVGERTLYSWLRDTEFSETTVQRGGSSCGTPWPLPSATRPWPSRRWPR